MQIIEIAQATGPQLLAFYNANATRVPDGKVTKKWSDLNSARKRTASLVERLASYIEGGKEGVDFPPEACIMFPEEGDEPTEGVKVEDYSDMAAVKPMEATDEATEEEEADEDNGAFKAMGTALNGLGDKPPVVTPRTDTGRASNSDGVARSWQDPAVRSARLTRDGVRVSLKGETLGDYKSTGEAWRALRLPAGKHIRFRLKLKELRVHTYEFGGETYTFEMVQIDAE